MYSESFPQLNAHFGFDNFEVIAEVLEKNFGDLFQLDVLNELVKQGKTSGSYWNLFQQCMLELKGLYTAQEVELKLSRLLANGMKIHQLLITNYIFVPRLERVQSHQIGWREKLLTSTLTPHDSLTYLDMVRTAAWMQSKARSSITYSVCHVRNLAHHLKSHDSKIILVNLTDDPKNLPKWGVINHTKEPIELFCEALLTEDEKLALESKLGTSSINYLGGTADFSYSTGLTALAWINDVVKRSGCALTRHSDYYAMVEEFTFMQSNLGYFDTKEHAFVMVEASVLALDQTHSIYPFTRAAILGDHTAQAYGANDLVRAALYYYKKRGTFQAYEQVRSSQTHLNARSFSLALDAAMMHTPISPDSLERILTEPDDQTVRLNVPEDLDGIWGMLKSNYSMHGHSYSVDWGFINKNFQDTEHLSPTSSSKAGAMVLTVFRSQAKKAKLEIHLPKKYSLSLADQRTIVRFMGNNAYVAELLNPENNASLEQVRKQLLPIFARNRWLQANGYLPPMSDDYWKQAARYWIIHLKANPDVLLPKQENERFKRCVLEMSVKGLEHVLSFLSDEVEHETLQTLYGALKPAFFATCPAEDYQPYFTLLLQHLQRRNYFPYSELGLGYQPGNNDTLLDLLGELNHLESFEKITFTNSLQHRGEFYIFLRLLIQRAQSETWTSIISIPELEDKHCVRDEDRELRQLYGLLNDIILINRQRIPSQKILKNIKEASDFSAPEESEAVHEGYEVLQDSLDEAPQELEYDLSRLNGLGPWPLKRGGAVQLQLQQQQQIQQARQIQKEQQRMVVNQLDHALSMTLVDYRNIDELLGDFYREYATEHEVFERAATLISDSETLLQGYFHTWINANPEVPAREVIQKMTLEAAKELLRRHRRLTSGLNPDNLPKGFYTQRSKDGILVLCYSPEFSYSITPTPLTINLFAPLPVAERWKGDFKLFNIDKYLSVSSALLDREDLNQILLFALLQPPKSNYDEDYNQFVATYFPKTSGLFSSFKTDPLLRKIEQNKEKVKRHWLIFLQTWQHLGRDGIEQFLRTDEADLVLSLEEATQLLLANLSPELREWYLSHRFDAKNLRALGQVYYRFGIDGVRYFLAKLNQIELALGREFFEVFEEHLLRSSDNFNCFMSVEWFTAMDDMIEKLKSQHASGLKQAWQTIFTKHIQSLGFEKTETLWHGFEYFAAEIAELGLELEGNEFDDLEPGNMLVSMDRILTSLKVIPGLLLQQAFLKNLARMDLTHGGVHYALQHERFKFFEPTLELHDFYQGTPTYAPDLANLYDWRGSVAPLNMQRALASQSRFNAQAFDTLKDVLGDGLEPSRHQLMWLLHTDYRMDALDDVLQSLNAVSKSYQAMVASHLHHAVYGLGHKSLAISLEAVIRLEATGLLSRDLLRKHPNGAILEAITILHHSNRFDACGAVVRLWEQNTQKPEGYPEGMFYQSLKLAVLFGVEQEQLQSYLEQTQMLPPVVQLELKLLFTQLLSVDYATSELQALTDPLNWESLMQCITAMCSDLAHTARHRISLIETFNERGIQFKYSKTGEFRALTTKEQDGPADLGFFIDHEERLWRFLQAHIAVPVQGGAQESLMPIIRFLKRLQLNRTYLNEIEPLLSTLEKTENGKYWSASYFYEMLRAFQPDNDQTAYPISLLKAALEEHTIAPKPIDGIEKSFPVLLVAPIQAILKNTVFNRAQQTILCKIALKEFDWQGSIALVHEMMAVFANNAFVDCRGFALNMLSTSKTFHELELRFEKSRWLLQHPGNESVARDWPAMSTLWLKALSEREGSEALLDKIRSKFEEGSEQQALMLHILAFSTLRQGLKDTETYNSEYKRKGAKLIERLMDLSLSDLHLIANTYPQQPSPGADDLLRLIKSVSSGEINLPDALNAFLSKPFPEPRSDYGDVASTREEDLQRMMTDTKVSAEHARQSLSAEHATRLTLIFAHLKHLESGYEQIRGFDKPVTRMTQTEIREAFKRLSQASLANPDDDALRAQVWAIIFEALARTTRKYPHLAQQFSLIANDVCVDVPTRVLQFATGEGKSHLVAMRAARNVGQGKEVDVCTAKRTLAQRDLIEDYQSFFDYLDIRTAYIHPKSNREEYVNSQVRYSTAGDISLFLDEQSYAGEPIEIDRNQRVALFDEFDFIVFEEGRKTEYNYARPTGATPKQMTWFYQAINAFYLANKDALVDEGRIHSETLKLLSHYLLEAADENEDRQSFVFRLLNEPLQLVQWLQSAHEAHELNWGIEFTVREVEIHMGDEAESYPMREVIPLSADNQTMFGSTYSAGVHQLLAVRLNTEARLKDEPQNFHIHPESHIISSQVVSQRMKQLWGRWEGFSGTISAAQAKTLNLEYATEVLHVPTNQRDLRFWNKPKFYNSADERLADVVTQIKQCIAQNKSFLFSCKNDKQVELLKQALQPHFSQEELEQQFIFFTNEEHRSPAEVLEDKVQMEHWHGGKKQRGIGLAASGFGRGDNVGVEAVFLFDVNDLNDLLQKGGRTGRNGEEGEVFQFYLREDLRMEEERLLQLLELHYPAAHAGIRAALADAIGDNEDEQCFQRVMALREFTFSLQNAANQGYRRAIAQLSSWGMEILGQVKEPSLRYSLTTRFSRMLKVLEKEWIDISSRDETPDDKIRRVHASILNKTREFHQAYADATQTSVVSFDLAEHQAQPIKLVLAKKPNPSTETDRAVASICGVLSRLSDSSGMEHVPERMSILEQHGALQRFAKRISRCTSRIEFLQKLELTVAHIVSPSEAFQTVEEFARDEIEFAQFFIDVSEATKLSIMAKLEGLIPELQTLAIQRLRQAGLLSMESRMVEIAPVLDYLNRLTPWQQWHWGGDYLLQLDKLLAETPRSRLTLQFTQAKPMPIQYFNTIGNIAKTVDFDACPYEEVLIQIEQAIAGTIDQRVRMLTKWETWVFEGFSKEERLPFLLSFCRTMEQFEEGRDWDVFARLVKKTTEWWNKGGQGQYQKSLIELWNILGQPFGQISDVSESLDWCMKLAGKSWFEIMLSMLITLSNEQLLNHKNQIEFLWQMVNAMDCSKSKKTETFTKRIELLSKLYHLLDEEVDQLNRTATLEQLKSLDNERFVIMLEAMEHFEALFQKYPKAFEQYLNYLADTNLTLEKIRLLHQGIKQAVDYHEHHPEYSLEVLLQGLARFRDKNEAVIKHVVDSFKTTGTPGVLFDNAALYLGQRASLKESEKIRKVMRDFYDASLRVGNELKQVFDEPEFNRILSFASDESRDERDQRIIFMHMLQQGVFIHDMPEGYETDAIQPIGAPQNEALLQAGYNRYLIQAQTILDSNPVKPRKAKVRDLSFEQESRLMQLANEFEVIGSSTLQLKETDNQVARMGQEVKSLLSSYQGTWFKAQHRKIEAEDLQQAIDAILIQPNQGIETRYELVLQAIFDAKVRAIDEDFKINQTRGWFKLNRGGKSRYLNTLNQMQDMVIRHIASDLHAVDRLPLLQHQGMLEISMLTEKLLAGLDDHNDEKLNPDDHRFKWFSSRLTQASLLLPKNRKKLNELMTLGRNLVGATQLSQLERNEAIRQLKTLVDTLRQHASAIPTHLTLLVHDMLARGDALMNKLQDQRMLDDLKHDLMQRDFS
ncbi:hypothetical protein [Legionella impletisoli]|uniref:SecA family profile domain-containing protein n=1 Tax=Legionella impletisoli TaxID=343510 RepID=A0A917NE18_9GAMM|nr:hypothetical protein [Legionella impletisoli]GGI91649.1 hypothetical protein GCM10007966_20390 [Legionella impletisoli]